MHKIYKNNKSNTYSEIVNENESHVWVRVFRLERENPSECFALWPKEPFKKWHESFCYVSSETLQSPKRLRDYLEFRT
jgi:hypothetical protein